jgi:hypothetical protein
MNAGVMTVRPQLAQRRRTTSGSSSEDLAATLEGQREIFLQDAGADRQNTHRWQ